MTAKEYILCAAIWYKDIEIKKEMPNESRLPVNCDRGLVFCGYRHHQCMYTMVAVTGLRSVETEVGEYVQGFLTSKNRFVDREEGAEIHRANGHTTEFQYRLFSEDLY
jgi:hypothetical protein